MADNIIANELSAKKITSKSVNVNGMDISSYIKEEMKKTKLDPVFKHWLSAESKLSSIGNNEISNYALSTDIHIPTAETFKDNFLSSSTVIPAKTSQLENDSGFLTLHQSLADYAKKTELPTAETFKDNFLSSSTVIPTAETFKDNFLSSSTKIPSYLSDLQDYQLYVNKNNIKSAISNICNYTNYNDIEVEVIISTVYNLCKLLN